MVWRKLTSVLLIAAVMSAQISCSKGGCAGPALNVGQLSSLRKFGLQSSAGPKAFLILPNPIDATNNALASVSDAGILSTGSSLNLASLLSAARLENAFLKVRVKDTTDALSTLAAPNTKGNYAFQPSDVRYSETMGYRSITAIQSYIEGLGFPIVKTRPLYVMVRAAGSTADEVNAFYDHAYLNPSAPRTIRVFGSSQFAPGMDQDIYWHEFGHLVNESVSAERGIDYAGDSGAVFSEAGALHECLADYLAESVAGRPYIGKWIARNIDGFAPGQPLRTASDSAGVKMNFGEVALADGTGSIPGRYGIGEWCTRVLWEIRSQFVKEDPTSGPMQSDRLVYSAVSLLKKDTSFSQFQQALVTADNQLHCGGHEGTIMDAFESRGFVAAGSLGQKLTFDAKAVTVKDSDDGLVPTTAAPGAKVVFPFTIKNPNGSIARNVRIRLESTDARLRVLTYQQSYGDLEGSQVIGIGGQGGNLGIEFSVVGQIDASAARGALPYRLRVMVENGQETVFTGVIQL